MRKFFAVCLRVLKFPLFWLTIGFFLFSFGLLYVGYLGSAFSADSCAAGMFILLGINTATLAFDAKKSTPKEEKQ